MRAPPPDPVVADTAPSDSVLTVYDEEHLITYLRLLDADVQGAGWLEVARIVLHLDPEHEFDRARRAFDSHLSRAKWMTEHGTCYVVVHRLKTTLSTAGRLVLIGSIILERAASSRDRPCQVPESLVFRVH
jgi:hypothetical protein